MRKTVMIKRVVVEEMPGSCAECDQRNLYPADGTRFFCRLSSLREIKDFRPFGEKPFDMETERASWCPLVEEPEVSPALAAGEKETWQ